MELFAEAVRVLQGEEDEESVALRALAMAYQGYFMAFRTGNRVAGIGAAASRQLPVQIRRGAHPR